MNFREELDLELLRSAKVAIQRSRNVQVVLLVSCVLALISYWNSRVDSWNVLRIHKETELANAASIIERLSQEDSLLEYRNYRMKAMYLPEFRSYDRDKLIARLDSALAKSAISTLQYRAILIPVIDSSFAGYLRKASRVLPNEADQIAAAIGGDTLTAISLAPAKEFMSLYRRARVEGVLQIKLPLIGLAFDVNDLALLAGLGFTLIMLAWGFILLREGTTISIIQDVVQRLDHSADLPLKLLAYQMVSTANVLTVSPNLHSGLLRTGVLFSTLDRYRNYLLFVLTKSLHFIPLAIYVTIMRNDRATKQLGDAVNVARTDFHMDLCWWFLAILIVVSLSTFLLNSYLEIVWKQIAHDVRKHLL